MAQPVNLIGSLIFSSPITDLLYTITSSLYFFIVTQSELILHIKWRSASRNLPDWPLRSQPSQTLGAKACPFQPHGQGKHFYWAQFSCLEEVGGDGFKYFYHGQSIQENVGEKIPMLLSHNHKASQELMNGKTQRRRRRRERRRRWEVSWDIYRVQKTKLNLKDCGLTSIQESCFHKHLSFFL